MDVIREGAQGHLVDVGDAEGLARGLVNVLTLGDSAWRAMSDAALATAMQYSWDDATTMFEAALRRAVARDFSDRHLPLVPTPAQSQGGDATRHSSVQHLGFHML